jgi:hypothetical protein
MPERVNYSLLKTWGAETGRHFRNHKTGKGGFLGDTEVGEVISKVVAVDIDIETYSMVQPRKARGQLQQQTCGMCVRRDTAAGGSSYCGSRLQDNRRAGENRNERVAGAAHAMAGQDG